MYDLIPIHLMSAGESAAVGQILGQVQQVRRMHELGFSEGALVEMVRPGSPCIVRMGGKEICFRGAEALSVLVRVGVAT
jgi:ferrous iron transport protein A